MDYEVDWLPSADDELLDLWMRHRDDGAAINAAASAVETALRRNAHRQGTRLDNYRYIIIDPLVFLFTAVPDDGRVIIVEVRYVR